MGAQSNFEYRRLRRVLQRPDNLPIRGRDLERETLPDPIERTTQMDISPLAGKPAPKEMLVDLSRLEKEYFERRPDLDHPTQRVSFGTSGHRGSPFDRSFTQAHLFPLTPPLSDYRVAKATKG